MRPRRSLMTALAVTLMLSASGPPAASAEQPAKARPTIVRVDDSGGFDWADAGVGAAGGVALSMLGVGLVLLVSARRPSVKPKRGGIMRLLSLFALLATLTVASAAAAQADDDEPDFNFNAVLRPAEGGPVEGFGLVRFRQPKDPAKIVYLDVRLRGLAPHHSYYLQRATDGLLDGDCTGTNWLTLGHGLEAMAIATDRKGKGRALLFRDLSAIPTGAEFDIHFRVLDAVSGAVVLESGCHQYTVRGPAQVQTLATFDPTKGEFPEGVAVDKRHNVYVGFALTGEIRRFDTQGASSTLATLPVGGGFLLGLATDERGTVYAALASFDPATHGVWRVTRDGSRERIAALPANGVPNALAFDRTDNLYVTDSALGAVWRIQPGDEPELFVQHPLLEPEGCSSAPGANGVALSQRSLLVANTCAGRIVRIPIERHGTVGEPTTLIERADLIGADGVALDVRGNLYVVMFGGPAGGRLVRISPDGHVEQLAGEAEGLTGPASLAFGTSEETRKALFITNFDLFSSSPRPALLRVDVGIPGWPLP
jgi:sugar lactone lactonase YvrE